MKTWKRIVFMTYGVLLIPAKLVIITGMLVADLLDDAEYRLYLWAKR